jgi:hypothetical protein
MPDAEKGAPMPVVELEPEPAPELEPEPVPEPVTTPLLVSDVPLLPLLVSAGVSNVYRIACAHVRPTTRKRNEVVVDSDCSEHAGAAHSQTAVQMPRAES